MKGWEKRAKMELVSMCRQLVRAVCRVSKDSIGSRPFEGFAQELKRQSGGKHDNYNDNNNENDNDSDNDNEK